MAPVSKHSETPKNRIARNFFGKCVFEKFWPKNWPGVSILFFLKPTQARKHELKIKWFEKRNLICKELGLVVDIWWWYMAAVVVAVVVYGYGSVVVYGHGLVVVYGYGFGAVADKRWW